MLAKYPKWRWKIYSRFYISQFHKHYQRCVNEQRMNDKLDIYKQLTIISIRSKWSPKKEKFYSKLTYY